MVSAWCAVAKVITHSSIWILVPVARSARDLVGRSLVNSSPVQTIAQDPRAISAPATT
jgi:hypothetical protein